MISVSNLRNSFSDPPHAHGILRAKSLEVITPTKETPSDSTSITFTFTCTLIYFKQAKPTLRILWHDAIFTVTVTVTVTVTDYLFGWSWPMTHLDTRRHLGFRDFTDLEPNMSGTRILLVTYIHTHTYIYVHIHTYALLFLLPSFHDAARKDKYHVENQNTYTL